MRISDWSSDVCSSDLKGQIFPFVLERLLSVPYVSPNWSDYPAFSFGRVMGRTVSMFHRECDVPACHMLSLMWGTGWPALYEHRNLAEVTHRSEEHTSELQSLMRISYAVFCLKKKK